MVASTITADLAVASNRDFRLMVARGDIAGAESFGSYGERTALGGETNRVIWPNGIFTLPPVAGVQMTVVSTSANDTAAGTHVRTIEIHYLDSNLDQRHETVIMAGLTPVLTTATDIRFIQCMHIQTVGGASTAFAAGDISASFGGVTYSLIAAGDTRCTSSARMIPGGKVAFVEGASASATSGTSAAKVRVRIVASELDTHQYLDPLILIPFGSIGVQDGSEATTFPLPLRFSAGTVIAMTVTTDKDANVNGDWFGWIEDI